MTYVRKARGKALGLTPDIHVTVRFNRIPHSRGQQTIMVHELTRLVSQGVGTTHGTVHVDLIYDTKKANDVLAVLRGVTALASRYASGSKCDTTRADEEMLADARAAIAEAEDA